MGICMVCLLAGITANAQEESIFNIEVVEGSSNVVPPKFGTDLYDGKNQGTGNQGLLKIDRIPNIVFGVTSNSYLNKTVSAKNDNPYIQISDYRGTVDGWRLSAKASNFVSDSLMPNGKKYVLSGAKLTFSAGLVESASGISQENYKPKTNKVTLNDHYQALVTAKENQGQGTWGIRWENKPYTKGNEQLQLFIKGNSSKPNLKYMASIEWLLESGVEE